MYYLFLAHCVGCFAFFFSSLLYLIMDSRRAKEEGRRVSKGAMIAFFNSIALIVGTVIIVFLLLLTVALSFRGM